MIVRQRLIIIFNTCPYHAMRFIPIGSFLLLGLLFSFVKASAQQFIQSSSISPDISVNFKLNERYTLNTKVEAFHLYFEKDNLTKPLWVNKFEGADFQFFLTRRLNPFSRAALGFQYGFEPDDPGSYRLIQQYSHISRYRDLMLGHRLRSDQTFYTDEATKIRLRYRISLEIPLQGLSLDPLEFFLLVSDEILIANQKTRQSLENRFVFNAGYMFSPSHKLQLGFDLRSETGNLFTENALLIKISWNINL